MAAIVTNVTPMQQKNTFSIGLMIALSSWALVFVTLIWGYVAFRLRMSSWFAQYLTSSIETLAIFNTLAITLSSWSLAQAFKKETLKSKVWAWSTFVLGVLFLIGQVYLWQMSVASGLHWQKSIAGSFFFLLTGFHAMHIVGGLMALLVLCLRFEDLRGSLRGLGIKYFWDFLFIVWVILFALIFIIQ